MRYLFRFACMCALGMSPLVGCSDTQRQCERTADCDDGAECTEDTCDLATGMCRYTPADDGTTCDVGRLPGLCTSGVCERDFCDGVECDDDNECTEELCIPADGTCDNPPVANDTECDFDGLPGLCKAGVCEDAMLCAGIECDDGNECTEDVCTPADGTCDNPLVEDDTECDFEGFPGLCKAGVCEDAMLCEEVECNDHNECTEDVCDRADGMCDHTPMPDGTPCGDGASACVKGACGACKGEEDAQVYECLEFVDSKGEMYTGTDAAAAIGNECLRGSDRSIPPIEGCGSQALRVVACFPSCPEETIQALADCVGDCTQDTTADLCPPGLSDDCVECTGASVACGSAFCTRQCVADPTAQMCADCRCNNNCVQSFETCSGIPSDQCDTAPVNMTVAAWGTEVGLEGVELCETDTDNCVLTDANGDATLWLPVHQQTSFTRMKEGYGSYLIATIIPANGTAFRMSMATEVRLATQHERVMSPYPMRGTGTIALAVSPRRSGATFDLLDATGNVFYLDEELNWSLDLNATTSAGAGGFVEVPPGEYQVEFGGIAERCVPLRGWLGDFENSVSFPVRAGYLSDVEVTCSCDAGSCGACGTAENGAVYDCLEFTDGKGEQHTGTDAAAAIGNECLLGSISSIPPIEGCGSTLLDVIRCFPNCPDATVQALAGCVADCTQDTTADLCPPGLSDDCVHCTGQSEACSAAFCTAACFADQTAPMCIDCRCANNCTPVFVTCSGIPSDQCN